MTQGHDHSCLSDGASPRLRALHIVTLCAFAFSQPILQILLNQSLFLDRQGLGWLEHSALLMALTFGVPRGESARLDTKISRRIIHPDPSVSPMFRASFAGAVVKTLRKHNDALATYSLGRFFWKRKE